MLKKSTVYGTDLHTKYSDDGLDSEGNWGTYLSMQLNLIMVIKSSVRL